MTPQPCSRTLPNGSFRRPPVVAALLLLCAQAASAQDALPAGQAGQAVPREVRQMIDRGLEYLEAAQEEDGKWVAAGYEGPGVTGLCVLALLASGEDPNFGAYQTSIRRGLQSILASQNRQTGYFGGSMYQHGFALLCLAEAYGAVDEQMLWSGEPPPGLTIGEALELAVRAALTAQEKNKQGAWRYAPDASDADTSVSGAVLVGLLAARNAGIEVPDSAIDKAVDYFVQMTSDTGRVGYADGLNSDESTARISIATLVYAISRRKELPQYKATLSRLTEDLEAEKGHWTAYARYYQAQALFQGDPDAWKSWNELLIRRLESEQQPDGSFTGQLHPNVTTPLSVLALAVNYRFLPIYER